MPFYEITYETGRSSIANYESDDEAKSAIGEQHHRALHGQQAGPIGGPAERVKKIRKYKTHPNEYNPSQGMGADVAKKEVEALIDALAEDGVISVDQLAMQVRALSHPMVTDKEDTFDSNYLMAEDGELDIAFLEAGDK